MANPAQIRTVTFDARNFDGLQRAAGVIAYGFTNRLTVIAGYLDLALDALDAGRSARADLDAAVGVAMETADELSALVGFANRGEQPGTDCDLGRLLRATFAETGAHSRDPVRLELDLDPRAGTVHVDPAALRQALAAIAANAHEAMANGGTLTVSTLAHDLEAAEGAERFPMLRPGPYVEIALADTGEGMEESVHDRCIEPFFSTKELPEHVGLGLSISFALVQRMDGAMEIESAPGHGTLVRLLLPRVDDDA